VDGLMPAPHVRRGPVEEINAHGKRLKDLELKPVKAAAKAIRSTLSALLDVRINYKVEDQWPQLGQVLTYRYAQGSKYPHEALWQPSGGALIEATADDSGTGDLEVSIDLVDSADWSDDQWWMVTATATVSGTDLDPLEWDDPLQVPIPAGTVWSLIIDGNPAVDVEFATDQNLEISTTTLASYGVAQPVPTGIIQLIPQGGVTVDHPEVARASWQPDASNSNNTMTIGWLYAGGAPRVQAAMPINSTLYPASHTLTVIARAWPAPFAPPAP